CKIYKLSLPVLSPIPFSFLLIQKTCSHIFLFHDAVQKPIQLIYDNPFPVLQNGEESVVSIDHIKPPHLGKLVTEKATLIQILESRKQKNQYQWKACALPRTLQGLKVIIHYTSFQISLVSPPNSYGPLKSMTFSLNRTITLEPIHSQTLESLLRTSRLGGGLRMNPSLSPKFLSSIITSLCDLIISPP
ncbi:unnamed protein product, partial [Hymenolepis diminuta]